MIKINKHYVPAPTVFCISLYFPTHNVDQTPPRRVARSLLSTHAHVSLIWSSSCQFRRTRVRVMISVILVTGVSLRCQVSQCHELD